LSKNLINIYIFLNSIPIMAKRALEIGAHEHMKANSAKGFDTPGMMPGWLKAAIIIGIAAAIVVAVFYLVSPGTGQHSGGTRNCILSVMGNAPDCSDNDGTLKDTYANGQYVGVCKSVDNNKNCIK
jgi:hypothetical protein